MTSTPLKLHRGFSLTELLVVIAILAVLTGVGIPVTQRFMERGRNLTCAGQLRQIGVSALLYASDHQFQLPQSVHQRRSGGVSWSISLQPYSGGKLIFRCPSDGHPSRAYSYILNDFLTANPAGAPQLDFSRLDRLTNPHSTLMFGESAVGYTGSDHFHFSAHAGVPLPPEAFRNQVDVARHQGGANYLFADGHVESLTAGEAFHRLQSTRQPLVDPTLRSE